MARNEKTKRVIEAFKESGYSQNQFAKLLGVSPSAVNQWVHPDKEINVDDKHIPAIARITRKSETWLLSGVGDKQDVLDENTISVPQIDVSASAGHGAIIFEDDQVLKRIDLNAPWLRRQCSFSHPDKLSVITASGDSMQPTISHGDFLLVDQGIEAIRSDSIYVAVVNGNLYVKRFQQTPRNTLLMISDNSAYQQFELNPEQDEIRVIGKVIYHWHGEKK